MGLNEVGHVCQDPARLFDMRGMAAVRNKPGLALAGFFLDGCQLGRGSVRICRTLDGQNRDLDAG